MVSLTGMADFTFKDAALKAVGRTVVNFQRLEHNLKAVARLGPLEGVLPKVQKDIERRVERVSSFTLGQSIQAWIGVLEGDGASASQTPDLFDPTIRLSFSLSGDPNWSREHGGALKELLE